MSSASSDWEYAPRRIAYALIHGGMADEPTVLVAADEESLSEVLALDVIASTESASLGSRLPEVRSALMERRWADALVAWMDATGRVVDVYPDEPIRSCTLDEEAMELELKLRPVFGDRDT